MLQEFAVSQPTIDATRHPRLLAAALLWLLGGGALLLTTVVPAHTALLGWTPLFWLLLAPLSVIFTLEPHLLRQLSMRRRPRRRPHNQLIWN
jgi:hypothetical protein